MSFTNDRDVLELLIDLRGSLLIRHFDLLPLDFLLLV